jgi:hypothetical protein
MDAGESQPPPLDELKRIEIYQKNCRLLLLSLCGTSECILVSLLMLMLLYFAAFVAFIGDVVVVDAACCYC